MTPPRVCCCAAAAAASLWLALQFQGMLFYDQEKRGGERLVARLSPNAFECKNTTPPNWPDIALLTSFWQPHPCSKRNRSICVGAGGDADRYPKIWRTARANHVVSAHMWNLNYLVGGQKGKATAGAICKKMHWVREALQKVGEGQWVVFVDADAGFRCQSSITTTLQMAQTESWAKLKANPSIIDFQNFGFFAIRNDPIARGILIRWTQYLQYHPLLCLLSTVPLQVSFRDVYGLEMKSAEGAHGRCRFVHIPAQSDILLHLIGQRGKANALTVDHFIESLNRETQCWLS